MTPKDLTVNRVTISKAEDRFDRYIPESYAWHLQAFDSISEKTSDYMSTGTFKTFSEARLDLDEFLDKVEAAKLPARFVV